MELDKLNNPMPYKWRVQSFSKNKAQAQCVPYIDARDVQKRFDEICGKEGWQDDYYQVGNTLFCKIGIRRGDTWIWKSDTGTESNIEKEKGHSSDAFKRAAVKWGVGRFLYDTRMQTLKANEKKTDNPKNWPYVVDDNGKKIWDITKHINAKYGTVSFKDESFLSKVAGFEKFNKDAYDKVLGYWEITHQQLLKVSDPETQRGLVWQVEKEIQQQSKSDKK